MSMFELHTCIVFFFFVADVHMLVLYNCCSNSRFKSSLELMSRRLKINIVLSCLVLSCLMVRTWDGSFFSFSLIIFRIISSHLFASVRKFVCFIGILKKTKTKKNVDCQILPDDLHSLAQWETDWHMKFNFAKCHCTFFCKFHPGRLSLEKNRHLTPAQNRRRIRASHDSQVI